MPPVGQADVPQAGDRRDVSARLRLKRRFLRTLVVSLTTCAVVAVVALLLGQFNRTTARILLTLGALALHSGIAMACAASLERRLWPRLSQFGLLLFGLNFAVLTTCVWWPGGPDTPALKALVTTAGLLGYYVLAIPCADLWERWQWGGLPLAGLGACAVGLVMQLVCVWAEPVDAITFGKATAIVAIVAFSLAHTCLLLRIPGGARLVWLLRATLAALWGVAVLASLMIALELDDELAFRLLGALGVTDACGSLALLIIAKLKQVSDVARLETAAPQVELRCPRCTASLVLDVGGSQCSACGLKIRIDVEEPRCAKCGYLLWQLPQRRCPECGTAF